VIERMTFAELLDDNRRLREALKTISQVAAISEGVQWYAFIADEALGDDDEPRWDVRPRADKGNKDASDEP
jgi:hypothetical protein